MNSRKRLAAIAAKRYTGPAEPEGPYVDIDLNRPPYPEGDVIADCVCGSWPGGECLKCKWIQGEPQP